VDELRRIAGSARQLRDCLSS